MASLKHFSDDELRKILKDHGISTPVTASTRSILLKKVNHILSSDKNEQQSSSSSKSTSRTGNRVNNLEDYRKELSNEEESPPRQRTPRSRTHLNSKSSSKQRNNINHVPTSLNSFSSDEEDSVKGFTASLKHLSDEELQIKLKEYGISSPVTASTRIVLVKKLDKLISSDKEKQNLKSRNKSDIKGSYNTKKLIDEDTLAQKSKLPVSEPNVNSKYQNNYAKKKALIPSNLNNFSSDEDDSDYPAQETHPQRLTKKSYFDGVPQDSLNTSPLFSNSNVHKKRIPIVRQRTGYSNLSYSDFKSTKLNNADEYHYESESDSDVSGAVISGHLYNRSNSNDNYISRREGHYGNNIAQKSFGENYSPHTRTSLSSKFKNDFNSDFHNSYETHLREREPGEITSPDDIVSQEPNNTHLQLSNGQGPFERVRKLAAEHCTLDRDFWLPSVPILLVVLLTLFFCILGLCYVSIHTPLYPSKMFSFINVFHYEHKEAEDYYISSEADIEADKMPEEDDGNKFPVCGDEVKMDCLSKPEMENVSEILSLLEKVILPALKEQSRMYQCQNMDRNHLTLEEMVGLITTRLMHKSDENAVIGVKGLGKLVMLNPHWGVKSVWSQKTDVDEKYSPQLIGFEIASSPVEILCLITSALYHMFYCVLICFVGILFIWVAFKVHSYFTTRAEELEQKSFELVEQILEVLENSCGTDGKEFIAVNHVRDCLIPPRERVAKSKIWNKAVMFIDDHDSRVYREIRSVGGEDCEVWRWVSGAPRSPVSCSKGSVEGDFTQPPEKIWQGQAFESMEATQNLPHVSPTSCLKVRNMFDCEIEFGDNWTARIQDSLLEKCEGIPITHVAVDRISKEGCVYVKCATAAGAGKAYRALHGWWFDRNLVTVKYLREERYFERFPTAKVATTILRPSNNKRLSLQNYPSSCSPSPSPTAKHSSTRTNEYISRFSNS